MLFNERVKLFDVGCIGNAFEFEGFAIALFREFALGIPNISDTATHAGAKVTPSAAKDDNASTRHILTAVVTDTLDYRARAAVSHCEALGYDSANIGFAAGRAIEVDVTCDDVLLGFECALLGWIENNFSARQALTDEVICVALNRKRDAFG